MHYYIYSILAINSTLQRSWFDIEVQTTVHWHSVEVTNIILCIRLEAMDSIIVVLLSAVLFILVGYSLCMSQ